jgi:hypothetical protein
MATFSFALALLLSLGLGLELFKVLRERQARRLQLLRIKSVDLRLLRRTRR